MKGGMFIQPMMLPERTVPETHQWYAQSAMRAEEYGLPDVYVGEHHTVRMKPIPYPDLVVTDILSHTKTIRVGTAGFVLPLHHPAKVANRVPIWITSPATDSTSGSRQAACLPTATCSILMDAPVNSSK